MPRPLAAFFLLLILGTAATAQPRPNPRERQERRVVLSSGAAAPTPELRVAAGFVTVVLFDAALDRSTVELEGRMRFRRVDVGERAILLAPDLDLTHGERLMLRVRFADGASPGTAVFSLVTHAEVVDGQVEVFRHPLEPEALQAELARVSARLTAVTAELEALKARSGVSGPAALVMAGFLDARGVRGERIRPTAEKEFASGLQSLGGTGFRASTWAMIALQVRNHGMEPWTPTEARLTSTTTGERVRVIAVHRAQPEIAPGGVGLMVVELEVPSPEAGTAFALEVSDTGSQRHLLIPKVTF